MGVIGIRKNIKSKNWGLKIISAFFALSFFFVAVASAEVAPTISEISPNNGLPEGGTSVTITGTNFSQSTIDANTKLLIQGNGTGASFVDSEITPKTVTAVGNVTQSTAQSKFGGSSVYLDGNGDYLSLADSEDWAFGTGDFTMDMWVKTTESDGFLLSQMPSNGAAGVASFYSVVSVDGKVIFVPDYVSYPSHHTITSTVSVNDDAWHHIAFVRNGAYIRMYIDGTESGTALNMGAGFTMTNSAELLKIGSIGLPENYSPYGGYIDEIRVSKGIARWTSNFTPPSSENHLQSTLTIGGTSATNIAVTSPTTITATTPAHAAGAADVVVTNYDGQSATLTSGYTFNAAPTISAGAVTPASAKLTGGDTITITGSGFYGTPTVTLGGTAATAVTVVNPTTITATTPAHSVGAVDVVITNEDSQSATLANGFTFTELPPTVSGISPSAGSPAGGTSVTISGTNFLVGDVDTYTKVLLHGDGTGASFVDSELIPKVVTAVGNATQSAAQSKFGGKSMYFDGSGDYLDLATSADFGLGTGDFTVDCWVNFSTVTNAIFVNTTSSANGFFFQYYNNAFTFGQNNVGFVINTPWTPSINTWYHIAVTRASGTTKGFINGTQIASVSDNYNYANNILRVGESVNGYLDEVRVSKGIARWTSDFTPPSAEYHSQPMLTFGGISATNVAVTNPTTITATTPAHTAGATDVVVTNYDGQSATLTSGYTFNPAPTISAGAVSPASALKTGGDTITITGTGFYGTPTVTLGGTAATAVTVVNPTTITATTPAHSVGAVDVVITNEDSQSSTLTNGFTFTELPSIVESISPNNGPVAGGTNVTITGTNFIENSATGGTITTSGEYTVHTFTGSGTFVPNNEMDVEVLVVAGGGGGGGGEPSAGDSGGGGGAGGYRTGTMSVSGVIPVTVGLGGAGAPVASDYGSSGSDSVFSTISSAGGGYGGREGGSGGPGGSGGGAGGLCSVPVSGGAGNTPATTPSQGNNGGFTPGTTCSGRAGSGGGGAGGVGGAGTTVSGVGGAGVASDITGTSITRAVGGAGGQSGSGIGTAGAANTGNGGKGGGISSAGGAGGSGVVIVRYLTHKPVVTIGGTSATNVAVTSPTTITATTPAHTAGTADVVVTNYDGQSATLTNGYTFNPAPTISAGAVSPASAKLTGGDTITITGTGFYGTPTVTLGGTAATAVTVVNPTTITATTPAHSVGAVDVVITNEDSQSATLTDGFTFTELPPTVSGISPNNGPVAGGTSVTITGTNFLETSSDVNTKLMLHGNGVGSMVVDSRITPKTISVTGSVTQTSTQSKFGGSSISLNGSSYLSIPDSADFDFGSGDFTIDTWVRLNTVGTDQIVWGQKMPSGYSPLVLLYQGTNNKLQLLMSSTGTSWDINQLGTASYATNNWYHIAAVRSGTSVKVYINGVLDISITTAVALVDSSDPFVIGAYGAGQMLNGYIDEFRVSKGIALWTSNFAPPTAPYYQPVLTIGGTVVTNTLFASPTTITATTPAHIAGATDVVVTNYDGQSATLTNGYTFNPAPTLSTGAVTPASAKLTGGDTITITGTGFYGTPSVTLGGTAATTVTVVNPTTITATTPAHSVGAVDVVITNEDSQSATLTDGFAFTELPPTVSSISPDNGPVAGGTNVMITGTNFINYGVDTYTKLLLHSDGAGTTFVDSETTPKTVTAFGNATQSSTQSKFGGKSAYLDGTSYLTIPSSADFEFGNLNFTMDWWEYRSSTAAVTSSISRDSTSGYPPFLAGFSDGNNLLFFATTNGASWDIASSKSMGTISINQWVHFAITRNGSNWYIFKNGSLTDSWTSSATILSSANPFSIGRYGGTNYFPSGYMDEIRISKGVARWTADFTPQVMAYGSPDVIIDGIAATNVSLVNPTTITAITPAHASGATDVVVTNYDGQSATLTNAFEYHNWITAGTYTSTVKPLANVGFGNIDWVAGTPANTNLTMRVKSCTSADCSDKPSWSGCDLAALDNGTDISGKGCVVDGQGYVQYQAYLSTDSNSAQPYLDSVTISTQPEYSKTFLSLISSPFDTGNESNSVQKISWAATNDTIEGTVQMQIRTAPDNGGAPDFTNSVWCGPTDCSATTNSTTAFATSYYTDKTGALAINAINKDLSDDRWIQYATFLKSADGTLTPTLTDVTMQYAYNIPPAITIDTNPVFLKQNSDGTFSVPYTLSETYDDFGNISHGTSGSPIKALLFYQPKSDVTLNTPTPSSSSMVEVTKIWGVGGTDGNTAAGAYTFTVPEGVTNIRNIEVAGGGGGSGNCGMGVVGGDGGSSTINYASTMRGVAAGGFGSGYDGSIDDCTTGTDGTATNILGGINTTGGGAAGSSLGGGDGGLVAGGSLNVTAGSQVSLVVGNGGTAATGGTAGNVGWIKITYDVAADGAQTTGLVTLNNPSILPIPVQGSMLIGDELMTFDSVGATGNQRNITARGAAFATSYPTTAAAHLANSAVFFATSASIHTIDTLVETGTVGAEASIANTFIWNPRIDANANLNGGKFSDVVFKVAANDADSTNINNIGQSSATTSQVLDLEAPLIKNITSSSADGKYNAGKNVDVTINFADSLGNAKNVTSTGAVTIVLETGVNNYECLFPSITNASSASCTYQVQTGDVSEDLTAISVSGTIKDQFQNQLSNFAIPAGQNIADSKAIIVDTISPIISSVAPAASAFVNSITSANGGSDISYEVTELLKTGSYVKFTSTSGTDLNTEYLCTLQGTALEVGVHSSFEIKQDANNCAEVQSALQSGSVYTMTIHAIDEADNASDQTIANINFDTTNPTASVTSPSNDAFFNSITTGSDVSYNLDEQLQTGSYLKFTRTAGSADGSSPRTCNLTGTELEEGDHNNVDLNAVCGGFALVDGAVYSIDFFAKDLAGNEANATQKINVTFDQTAPTLTSFTSDKANNTPATAYGAGEVIDIKAVYSESLAAGSTMTVRLENTATPAVDVVLDQIAGNVISGTFVVDGPRKGYDTADLTLRSIVSQNAIDQAGNVKTDSAIPFGQNLGDNKDIAIDTGTPILESFAAQKLPENSTSGSYKAGTEIKITATYSKPIASGEITLHLNTQNGAEDIENIVLSTISGSTIFGTHTVQNLDNAEDLKVFAITAQSVTDFKGNVLDRTGTMTEYDAYFTSLVGENISAVTNISNFKIDTTAPTLGATPIAIANVAGKTSSATPVITLSATDNDISKAIFSLDGGTSWCAPIDYGATINTFDITSSACGGSASNEVKTVTVKFSDVAGNESVTSSASVEYDNLKPQLQTITADVVGGIYGPNSVIKITATYDEDIASGTLVVNLNNGKQLTINTVETARTLVANYTVGATISGEDTSALRVAAIVSQAVSDSAANTQDGTSLAGITANIDTDKTIIIDTTAPSAAAPDGSIVADRASEENKIKITISPDDWGVAKDEMTAQIALMDTVVACNFTGANAAVFNSEFPKTFTYDDLAGAVKKVCVKLTDKAGNISSDFSVVTPNTPENFVYTDLTSATFTGAILKWDKPTQEGTGDFKQYNLLRCENAPCTLASSQTITDKNQNYYVFNNLDADTNYCYALTTQDVNNDISKITTPTICATPGDGPVATDTDVAFENDPFVANVSKTGASVVFKTIDSANSNSPLATTASVEVYSDEGLTTLVKTVTDTLAVTHSVDITGLDSGSNYYLKITATDTSIESNPNRSVTVSFASITPEKYYFATAGALSAITISNQPSILTDTKAVVDFSTDQNAKCFIDFKEAAVLEYNEVNNVIENEARKNHSITISPLLAQREYNYKITCVDDGDATNIITKGSSEGDLLPSFVTLAVGALTGEIDKTAPEISSVSLASVTGESATITWNTDEKANSSVAYEAEGASFTKMEADWLVNSDTAKYTTSHSVVINNLVSDTKYLFTVMSTDAAGNIALSSQSALTTKQPSTLSSIKVVSTALGQATITWSTGEASSSSVEYGLTTAYGQKKEDSSKVKEHQIILSELEPGETYHFRVKGQDAEGNIFSSSDITFQPKSPPKISDFRVDSITEHSAMIYFATSVPTDALITYTDANDATKAGLQGNPNITAKHEIKLRDLSSGATFGIKIKVRDEDGNETEETFPNITTTKDETPPIIDNIKTDAALAQNDKVQAIISWKTDEMSTGKIVYKEGKNGDEKTFEVNSAPAFSHIGVITSFKSGVVYYFKVIAIDQAGNEATSTNYGLLTPKKTQNIIQIIIGNFTEIFGWAKF